MEELKKSKRGFASMDPEKQRADRPKRRSERSRQEAQLFAKPGSGRQSGAQGRAMSVDPRNRSFARDHVLASEAGRKGGHASHSARKPETA